jgi:hypothetical protein|tara:strand:+ start:4388 stop:4654 length:267 start_codon:yes stop_codon:yes gene_type:complete
MIELEDLESALRESRLITKEAKYLEYSVNEIQGRLSSLAKDVELSEEMEYYLNGVSEALWELQSAFFRCDELFEEAISEEELKSYVDQ